MYRHVESCLEGREGEPKSEESTKVKKCEKNKEIERKPEKVPCLYPECYVSCDTPKNQAHTLTASLLLNDHHRFIHVFAALAGNGDVSI